MKLLTITGGTEWEADASRKNGEFFKLLRGKYEFYHEHLGDDAADGVHRLVMILARGDYDAVCVATMGGWGNDATIPSILEANKIPYTCSGPTASVSCLDKWLTRCVIRDVVQVPLMTCGLWAEQRKLHAVGPADVVVKPATGSGSRGVCYAATPADFLKLEFADDERVVVEGYARGLEVTVAVLDGVALGAATVRYEGPILGQVAKAAHQFRFEQMAPGWNRRHVMNVAANAVGALGCAGPSRVDLRRTPNGPVVLDVNSQPGLYEGSPFAFCSGLDQPELAREILARALARPR